MSVSLVSPAAAEHPFKFQTERKGNAVEILASAELRGSTASIWRVLTDYPRYSEFVPGMRSSRILKRDGDQLMLEQRGELSLLWVKRPLEVTLAVVEQPPKIVESTLISGSIKHMYGRYELTEHGNMVRLSYNGRIVPDDHEVSVIELIAIRSNAARQFGALIREIERVTTAESGQRRAD